MGEARNGCIASIGDLVDMAYEALALPSDDTALREALASEREKIEAEFLGKSNAAAIRSMNGEDKP